MIEAGTVPLRHKTTLIALQAESVVHQRFNNYYGSNVSNNKATI